MPVIPGTQVFLCYSRFSNGRGPKACIHLYANHCVPFEITPISPAALLYLAKNKEDSCFSSRRRLRICLNLLENKKNQALCMTQPSFRWKTGSTLSTFRLLLSKSEVSLFAAAADDHIHSCQKPLQEFYSFQVMNTKHLKFFVLSKCSTGAARNCLPFQAHP